MDQHQIAHTYRYQSPPRNSLKNQRKSIPPVNITFFKMLKWNVIESGDICFPCVCPLLQIHTKIWRVLSWCIPHPFKVFCRNSSCSSCLILLTNRQTHGIGNLSMKNMSRVCIVAYCLLHLDYEVLHLMKVKCFIISEVTCLTKGHQGVNLESIAEFLQIFEANYTLISIRITSDVTQGRE